MTIHRIQDGAGGIRHHLLIGIQMRPVAGENTCPAGQVGRARRGTEMSKPVIHVTEHGVLVRDAADIALDVNVRPRLLREGDVQGECDCA